MGTGERRFLGERGLVGGDGAGDVASLREPHPSLQDRARILTQLGDRGKDRILECRPLWAKLCVAFQGALRVIPAPQRPIRERQRVVRSSPLWELRDRLLQQLDRRLVTFFQGGNAPETEIAHRRGGRIGSELFVESFALGDLPRVEQGIGQLHASRFVVRRRGDGILEPGHSLGAARDPLQHQRIQVVPFERAGCQRLRAGIRSVRSLELFPRLQHAAQGTDRFRVVGAGRRSAFGL